MHKSTLSEKHKLYTQFLWKNTYRKKQHNVFNLTKIENIMLQAVSTEKGCRFTNNPATHRRKKNPINQQKLKNTEA